VIGRYVYLTIYVKMSLAFLFAGGAVVGVLVGLCLLRWVILPRLSHRVGLLGAMLLMDWLVLSSNLFVRPHTGFSVAELQSITATLGFLSGITSVPVVDATWWCVKAVYARWAKARGFDRG